MKKYCQRKNNRIAKKYYLMSCLGFALWAGMIPYNSAQAQPSKAAPASSPEPPKRLSESLTGMAKAEYEAGKILFEANDFENAVIKFEKAYELSKDPRILWNIAVCQKELRKYTRMQGTIRRMLNEGGDVLNDQDKKDAAEIVETAQAFITPLKIEVNESGADIFIDGEKAGVSPLVLPVPVDVGTRKIRVSKNGFKEFNESIVAAGGAEMVRNIKLEKEFHHGRLIVETANENRIYLDGKAVGKGRFEGFVSSGGHMLRVSAVGMQTYQSEVLILDNQPRRIQVSLNPLPADNSKWLWIGGGALLVTAAVVGGIFLFQPEDKSVVGTIPPGQVRLELWRQ